MKNITAQSGASGFNRLLCAVMASFFLLFTCCAVAEPVRETPGVTRLEYAFGSEALNRHLNNEKNEVLYQGIPYSFDLQAGVEFSPVLELYGENTLAVHEHTVPQSKYPLEDDGLQYMLGRIIFTPAAESTVLRFEGNRETGEYYLTDAQRITDQYIDEVFLPRDADGKPLLIDRVYLLRINTADQTQYAAFTYPRAYARTYTGAHTRTDPCAYAGTYTGAHTRTYTGAHTRTDTEANH